MENSTSIFSAFVKAQAEFKTPVKNCRANYGKYADLAAIFEAIRPALIKNGLAITQSVTRADGGISVETVLIHSSGERFSSGALFMPVTPNARMNEAQAFGSAETYARRYSLSAFMGVVADDDDDGNAAGINSANGANQAPAPRKVKPKITEAQIQELEEATAQGTEYWRGVYKRLPLAAKEAVNNDKEFLEKLRAACAKADEELKKGE